MRVQGWGLFRFRLSAGWVGGAEGSGRGQGRAWAARLQRRIQWEKGMLPGGGAKVHWAGCSHLWEGRNGCDITGRGLP